MAQTLSIEPQIPHPDTIEPQSPPETPAGPSPSEAPAREPPEVTPESPDIDEPGRGPDEMPANDVETGFVADDRGVGQGGVLQSNLDREPGGSVE